MKSDLSKDLQVLAGLPDRVGQLEERVKALERAMVVPAVVPLKQFPAYYQHKTGSVVPPVSEHQLRRWVEHRKRLGVDWIVRDGRAVLVDAEKFVAWLRRLGSEVRAKEIKP